VIATVFLIIAIAMALYALGSAVVCRLTKGGSR